MSLDTSMIFTYSLFDMFIVKMLTDKNSIVSTQIFINLNMLFNFVHKIKPLIFYFRKNISNTIVK